MRKRFFWIIILLVILGGSIVFARRIAWIPTEKPPVSLRLALALAEAELENEKVEYFCIGTGLAKTFSQGDWVLHFSSRQGKEIWINVSSDQKTTKSTQGFSY